MALKTPLSTQAHRDGRLRPVRNDDPLANIGLPSKGDNSLHDPLEQQRFFELILARERLIDDSHGQDATETLASATTNLSISEAQPKNSTTSTHVESLRISKDDSKVQILHHALRALRESLTATHRTDEFAQNAYLSIVRIGVKHCIWETYLPTLLQLLRVLRKSQHLYLQEADIVQCLQFEILDLACRQDDLQGAFEKWDAASRWAVGRKTKQVASIDGWQEGLSKTGQVLKALVHQNSILFWRMYRELPALHGGIMECVAVRIRREAIATLTKAYFSITLSYAEACFGIPYNNIVKEMDVQWEVEGDEENQKVVIRRPRAAAMPPQKPGT